MFVGDIRPSPGLAEVVAAHDGLMSFQEIVRRMTDYPARLVGLDGRGVLREGAAADVVVFDSDRVTDRSTWENPRSHAEGIPRVLVNGSIVVADGEFVGGLNGSVLRRESR